MKRPILNAGLTVSLIVGSAIACIEPPAPPIDEAPAVTEARSLFPRFIDVQQYIVGRSCAPNAGVCHNTFNYPDLHTPGNTLSMLRAFCNVELPEPTLGWNECERDGDVLIAAGFESEIAWIEQENDLQWRVGLRVAPDEDLDGRPQIYTKGEEVVLEPLPEWNVRVTATAGEREALIDAGGADPFINEFVGTVLNSIVGGDPNRDDVYGASDENILSGALVMPGNLERSYFWGRLTGTVPGTRMPLANEALTFAEYVAVACWIETLDEASEDANAEIDYDACDFAKAPIDYSLQ
jgi:hypothetical protein